LVVFPIHSLVAQSGLEFPVDEMFDALCDRLMWFVWQSDKQFSEVKKRFNPFLQFSG
jgi:hypothetical protein